MQMIYNIYASMKKNVQVCKYICKKYAKYTNVQNLPIGKTYEFA